MYYTFYYLELLELIKYNEALLAFYEGKILKNNKLVSSTKVAITIPYIEEYL